MVDDFRPTASLKILRQRSELLRAVRQFFHDNNYWETETPILSLDTVVDAHLDPFVLNSGRQPNRFLQTSPEFAMKRLVASGADRIYQIAKVFRHGELGQRHNPEFTMAEWYAVSETYHQQMDFVEQLFRSLHEFSEFSVKPFQRLTYDQAFEQTLGTTVLDLQPQALLELANVNNVSLPVGLDSNDRDSLLNLLLAEVVEPKLGQGHPTFVYDYPATQAALARLKPGNTCPAVAERFELYIDGIEFCNGYQELTDAAELRNRIEQENAIREREGLAALPSDSRLLNAMESGLPDCSGVALGIDRLAMWLFNCDSIAEVIAFPFDIA